MIYGLYLSATGVLTNSYRQDVIANNLANSETVGFKKDLALFQERRTAAQEKNLVNSNSDALLEKVGGGLWATPTLVDSSQGDLEPTGNNLDIAIEGRGYFAVKDSSGMRLTRDGRFMVDRNGQLTMSNDKGLPVLGQDGQPIVLHSTGQVEIGQDGQLTQNGKPAGRIGIYDVPDASKLVKQGGALMAYPDDAALTASNSTLRAGFVERSNVDPATEPFNADGCPAPTGSQRQHDSLPGRDAAAACE